MNQTRRNWSISPFKVRRSRLFGRPGGPLASPNHPAAVEVTGARISDRDLGLIYEATIERAEGKVWLSSLTILTTRKGQRIDQAAIRRVPVQRIAEAVSLHLIEQEREGMPVFSTEAPPVRGERPSLRHIAKQYREGMRRGDFASTYGVSIHTVDEWIGDARTEGLIPPATTGRPRKNREEPEQ